MLLLYPGAVATGQEITRLGSVLADLNLRFGVLISVLPISAADYGKAVGPFWQNVRREGVRYAD